MEEYLSGKLSDRLRELRESRNLTKADVAKAIGINRSTYGRIEEEVTESVDSKYLIELARFYDVTTDFLLGINKRIKENDLSAGNDIIDENENLIKTVIQKLRKYYGADNIEIDNIDEDDLMQEGRIALMNAAKTFDEDSIWEERSYRRSCCI